MTRGRDIAQILAEWREVERLVDETDGPFERAELLRRAKRLRHEYAQRVDEISDVTGHVADFPGDRGDDPEDTTGLP
jgi:hypothetical protein